MTKGRFYHLVTFLLLLTSLASTIGMIGCSTNKKKAKSLIAEYLTGQGVTDISIDVFHPSTNFPDKAYTSATITYNFASSSGKPQREFLGFILSRQEGAWRIEKSASYTADESQAEQYIVGKGGK
jgi:hypothetical protein